MGKSKKKPIKVTIDSLRESVTELIAMQNKVAEVHSKLIALLKGYCSTIDITNTSKKYAKEINKNIAEVQEKINFAIDTAALLNEIFANLKNAMENGNIAENESLIEDCISEKEKILVQVSENYNELLSYVDKYDNFIQTNDEPIQVIRTSTDELEEDVKNEAEDVVNSNQNDETEVQTKTETKTKHEDNLEATPEIEIEKVENELENQQQNEPLDTHCLDSNFIENRLLISETQNKVVLPYTLGEIKERIACSSNENLTIQNVIDNTYTIPLSNYKNSVVSRFSESFKLVRNKEHGSIKDALDLALETAFNYNLHPAVITACDNINELDIYLACLEYNELEDFKFFDVNFEVAPTLSRFDKF